MIRAGTHASPREVKEERRACRVSALLSDAALLTQRGREGTLPFVMCSGHQLHGVLAVGENHRDGPLVLRSYNYAALRRHRRQTLFVADIIWGGGVQTSEVQQPRFLKVAFGKRPVRSY